MAPTQSLHLPHPGLGSALPIKGSPTSRAFTHAVSDEVSSERTLRCCQSQACCQLHQGAEFASPSAPNLPPILPWAESRGNWDSRDGPQDLMMFGVDRSHPRPCQWRCICSRICIDTCSN